MNSVNLIGRLTKDPEIATTSNNVSYCNFVIAVDRDYKDQNGERPTDFISCTAWRGTADFMARNMGKGERIGLTGTIQTRSWIDENNERQYRTDVIADQIYFADGYRENVSSNYHPKQKRNTRHAAPPKQQSFTRDDTSLPFDL